MAPDLILQNIAKHIVLNKDETSCFISLLAYKEIPKKTSLLTEGQADAFVGVVPGLGAQPITNKKM